MADISKITIDNTTFDIKDSIARNTISTAMTYEETVEFGSWTNATTKPTYASSNSKIVFGNNLYFTVNSNSTSGTVGWKSTDLLTWTQVTLPAAAYWVDCAFGNGIFIALASGANKCLYKSEDLVTWEQLSYPTTEDIYYSYIVWTGTQFLVSETDIGTRYYKVSSDGTTWTQKTFPNSIATNRVGGYPVTNNNGNIVFRGYVSTNFYVLVYSVDGGNTWAEKYYGGLSSYPYLGIGDNNIIVMNASGNEIIYDISSQVFTQYTNRPVIVSNTNIVFGSGMYMMLSTPVNSKAQPYYSSDGINWTLTSSIPTTTIRVLSYANNNFIGQIGASATASSNYSFFLPITISKKIKQNGIDITNKIIELINGNAIGGSY